jgi:flavin reductase (DIM6/NTAB) family NADH-FMN oxidoreductase RutF
MLDGAVAHFDCDLAESYQAATHVIITARVRHADYETAAPLLYTRRRYGVPVPLPAEFGATAADPAPREDLE